MSGNLAKVREKAHSRGKLGKGHRICLVGGNLIVAAQQNSLPVFYLYCNSFFIYVMFTENFD